MEEKILEILKVNPNLSNSEIGKLLGVHRSNIQYYMNKLNIHRDRKMQQRLNNTCREKKLPITDNAEQIILGSILGDGYMSPNRHPQNSHLTLNSELRIAQGKVQEEYVIYKKELLEKEGIRCHLMFLDNRPPHMINGIEVKENGTYQLKTQRNVSFNFYRNMFYRPKKRLCRYLYKLKALGLAIWFMDDGYKNGNGFKLATDGFTWNEVVFLQKIMKHNFNLDTTIQKTRLGYPSLYIRTSCRQIFIDLVSPYICDSMKYKLEL